jgi:G3E family GTPase
MELSWKNTKERSFSNFINHNMEPIIAIVGFLGAGKTTLLHHLTNSFLDVGWKPYIILNDYENAYLDAQQLATKVDPKWIQALNGSCICCSGIAELRDFVNRIPIRVNGITLIEANGTSDACSLMGFLGVGLANHFMPPVQISVVDVKNWQLRGEHNELEASQIKVSSLIVLSHTVDVSELRKVAVIKHLQILNPSAKILSKEELNIFLLPQLIPSNNSPKQLDHLKSHWSSCSVDLPWLPKESCIQDICNNLPKSILRLKGCTKIGTSDTFTFFERTPDGTISIRPYNGEPITGPKLLSVGPGSEISVLNKSIQSSLEESKK